MNEKCVCSLIRINGFDEKGNCHISQGIPLLTKTFDSINEAAKYGEEHLGEKMVWSEFWGDEYDNADLTEIIVGYKLSDKKNDNGFLLKMCNPQIISKLLELYEQGGQRKMLNDYNN